MKRIFARAAFALLVLVLCAPALWVGALALSGSDPLLHANLDRADFEFDYVPQANSEYALYLFSDGGGDVHARGEILQDGNVIAQGEGTGAILSAWLAEGQTYTVRIHGRGRALIEMARTSLSRCRDNPLQLFENEPFEKVIAHAYDAHWYAFEAAEDAAMLITCIPRDDLKMQGMLFDDRGACIAGFEALDGGAAALRLQTDAGERYFIRISAPEGGEGGYALRLNRPEPDAPDPSFDTAEAVIAAGSEIDLGAEAGEGALLWLSSDPSVARVSQDGRVLGLRKGEATITARGLNESAQCRVQVEFVALEGLEFVADSLILSAGDDADLMLSFLPENASDTRVEFQVQDPSIAAVSRSGVLRALQPGETIVTAKGYGGLQAALPLTVTPAVRRYRALLVGEENYPFSENARRSGSENSVAALQSLLETAEFGQGVYSVRTASDLSRSELIAAIRHTFMSATAQDVSLLYITSHGFYSGGMSFLELSDGSVLSVRDLERELRSISGAVVVMIDACGSGGAIGAASDRAAFAKGVTAEFAASGLRGGKYRVLASAGLDEDSFRLAFNQDAASGMMSTVFVRALCDGGGWDMDRGVQSTMGADADYDGRVTLAEMQVYLQERVDWYMKLASDLTGEDYRQSVQVYPQGDPLVLLERNFE